LPPGYKSLGQQGQHQDLDQSMSSTFLASEDFASLEFRDLDGGVSEVRFLDTDYRRGRVGGVIPAGDHR